MPDTLFFVFANPTEGQDDAFNDWYDNTHIDEVLAVPDITAAQRYSLNPIELPESDEGPLAPPVHRYLTVYEVDGDPAGVMADFVGRIASGAMALSPALDISTVSLGFWSAAGPRRTSA